MLSEAGRCLGMSRRPIFGVPPRDWPREDQRVTGTLLPPACLGGAPPCRTPHAFTTRAQPPSSSHARAAAFRARGPVSPRRSPSSRSSSVVVGSDAVHMLRRSMLPRHATLSFKDREAAGTSPRISQDRQLVLLRRGGLRANVMEEAVALSLSRASFVKDSPPPPVMY